MSLREENISTKKIYDKFRRLGSWYLPENKDKTIPGIIIYDKGKIGLETMTSLEKPNEEQFFPKLNLRKHDIVFGKLDTGETIILMTLERIPGDAMERCCLGHTRCYCKDLRCRPRSAAEVFGPTA